MTNRSPPSINLFYSNLTAQQRKQYIEHTKPGYKHKGKALPEHVLRKMAEPRHRDELLPSVGFTDESVGTGTNIPNRSSTGPSFYARIEFSGTGRCDYCKTEFLLSTIKYFRLKCFGPEYAICAFCRYRIFPDGLPDPKANEQASSHPQLYKRYKTLEDKVEAVKAVLSKQGMVKTRPVLTELTAQDEHGRMLIDQYFSRDGHLYDPEVLLEDFIGLTDDSIASLPEFIY